MSSYLIYESIVIPSFYLFLFLYLIRFVMVVGGEDWFVVWMGLEINIISFLIIIYRRYEVGAIESCLKYFFIQSLGSALLIMLIFMDNSLLGGISSLVLRYKIGAGPFYFWFPRLCRGLDWLSCFILILFQKILPLCLIFFFIHWILWLVIIFSLVLGVLGSFNQRGLKQLMAYSSIHHLGWILILGMGGGIRWIIYLFVYGLVLIRVIFLFLKEEIVDLSIIFSSSKKKWLIMSILRIGGVPPLLGFYLRWLAFISFVECSLYYIIMLIVTSVVMLYIYIRIIYDILMGGGDVGSWFKSFLVKNDIFYDFIGLMGLFFGIYIGLLLVI